jgi:GTPase
LKNYRSGYITIIGKPNVGKSTLLNELLDFKLSITSPRPQTTRRKIMGIMSDDEYQLIFLDTPGIIEPKYQLQQIMINHIQSSVSDADALVYIIDVSSLRSLDDPHQFDADVELLKKANLENKPVLLVLNKIDLIEISSLLPIIEKYTDRYNFEKIIPVSALKRNGLEELRAELIELLPVHPPYYDPEIITEQPERFFVAELIREQIFHFFKQEIPYATEVQIEEFKERERGKDLIRAVIYTERDTQKAILIGKKGSALKKIGQRARNQIEKFLEREVYLDLRVKVRKDWRRDDIQIKRFGYS